MIISGYEYKNDKPFKNVYLTGLVRDKQGRKMSKSLGNSPEPIELIEKFGADGVRVGMLLCSPAGNDLLYNDSLPEQGRNFANKIWNAFRLVKTWQIDDTIPQPDCSKAAVAWMNEILKKSVNEIDDDFKKFRISEALMVVYKLFWDEFSGWFLETIKPEYQKPIDKETYESAIEIFENLLKIIHPFMPFITEEIWQLLKERRQGESIMISAQPDTQSYDKKTVAGFEIAKEIVSSIRTIRKEKEIPQKEKLQLLILDEKKEFESTFFPVIIKLCNLSEFDFVTSKQEGAVSFLVGATQFFIPLESSIDPVAEIAKLEEDLKYNKGFLENVMNKLDNERFVQNAPANVLELERKKKSDAEAKIVTITERIGELKKGSA
jgi:valyl-tRNA synthetase